MPHLTTVSRFLIPIGAIAVLIGCSDANRSATQLQVQIDTLGDTIRVHNLAGSEWGDTARLEPVISIGTSDGPDEYLLGRVAALAIGPAGKVFVTDRQVPALRAYDAEGRFISTFGREGSGPGEYRQPDGGLAALTNGNVVLRDPGNGRMTVYDSTGTMVTQWMITSGFSTGRKLYRSSDDQLYTMILETRSQDVLEWTYGLAQYRADGTLVDTVTIPDLGYEPPQVSGHSESGSSTQFVPFTPNAPWTFSPSKAVVTGIGDTEFFTVFQQGRPLTIRREIDPVAVQSEEGAEQQQQIAWQMEQNFPGWRWNGDDIPSTKPAFSALIAAEDGSYWAQVATPGRATMTADEAASQTQDDRPPPLRFRSPVAYDVFGNDGRYRGRVVAPDGFQIYPEPVIRGDTVWAVAEDPESGTPQVVRYLVARPPH